MRVTKIATGTSTSDWQVYDQSGITIVVDTSSAGFSQAPQYFTSLGGDSNMWKVVGITSIYKASQTSFQIYLKWADGSTLAPTYAKARNWKISWVGIEMA